MQLRVDRVESDNESTLGRLCIDGKFQCWTLEDQHRTGPKVKAETRIPAGRYQLKLRQEGGFHAKYLEKYGPEWHRGMLHVTNVPGFEYILIHIGNSHDDTEGCLLVGDGQCKMDGHHYVTGSRPAYETLYPKVRDALLAGMAVDIEYVDADPATLPATDATLVSARGPASPPAAPTPSAAKAAEPAPATGGSGHSGAVAATAGAAGAAVVAVGAAEVLAGDGSRTAEAAPAAPAVPAAPDAPPVAADATPVAPDAMPDAPAGSGDLVSKITDPDNLLKIVLIGLGVVVVICAIYFIVRRVGEARARKTA